MNRCALILAALATLVAAETAHAFPPTATVSPGYDRALAESRRARRMEPPVVVLPAPQLRRPHTAGRHHRR